jgi:hypothetical protein
MKKIPFPVRPFSHVRSVLEPLTAPLLFRAWLLLVPTHRTMTIAVLVF